MRAVLFGGSQESAEKSLKLDRPAIKRLNFFKFTILISVLLGLKVVVGGGKYNESKRNGVLVLI